MIETPWTVAHQAPLSLGSPGKNTGVGCHLLLQGSSQPRGGNCVSCVGRQIYLSIYIYIPISSKCNYYCYFSCEKSETGNVL